MATKKNKKKTIRSGDVSSPKINDKLQNLFPFTKYRIYLVVAILALTALCYLPVFKNGFINIDDNKYIYENILLQTNSSDVFFTEFHFEAYHPLLLIIYSFIYKLFGLNPVAYHLFSFLFHILNTFLVFLVFRLLFNSIQISSIVSLFFGIHPLQVESVAWASELKTIMYGFFFLLALFCYLRYLSTNLDVKYYLSSLLFFLFSVLTNYIGISFAILIIIIDIFLQRNMKDAKVWFEKIPFLLFFILFGYITLVSSSNNSSLNSQEIMNLPQSIILGCLGFITYLWKIIFPSNLSIYYPISSMKINTLSVYYYLYPLALLVFILIFIRLIRFSKKYFLGMGFLVLLSIPIIKITSYKVFPMNDSYAYIPSIGFYCIMALLLVDMKKQFSWKYLSSIVLAVFVFSYAILSLRQVRVWKDSVSVWNNVILKFDDIPLAYQNRGSAKFFQKDYSGALNDYTKAIKLFPEYSEAYFSIGTVKDKLQDYPAAIEAYNKAIEMNPDYAEAYNNRGNAYNTLNEYISAVRDFDKAIILNPNYAEAYNNRGTTRALVEDYPNAINDFTRAIALKPNYVEAYFNRGLSRVFSGDKSRGCSDLVQASEWGVPSAADFIREYCN